MSSPNLRSKDCKLFLSCKPGVNRFASHRNSEGRRGFAILGGVDGFAWIAVTVESENDRIWGFALVQRMKQSLTSTWKPISYNYGRSPLSFRKVTFIQSEHSLLLWRLLTDDCPEGGTELALTF
jgi:hypothetical protein